MRIGNREFDTENGVYVMGILNVTPEELDEKMEALFHAYEV